MVSDSLGVTGLWGSWQQVTCPQGHSILREVTCALVDSPGLGPSLLFLVGGTCALRSSLLPPCAL